MSFSSRRRNYLLTPHRRDGLVEWMKSMLMHSFVLNALDSTGADTFSHFELLIDEHREMTMSSSSLSASTCMTVISGSGGISTSFARSNDGDGLGPLIAPTSLQRLSRLKRLVPTVGTFHTPLPLRRAFEAYNAKYALTSRRHVQISFNEIRHILNLAQIMALSGHCGTTSKPLRKHRKGILSSSSLTLASDMSDDGSDVDNVVKQWEGGCDSPSALLVYQSALSPPPLSLDGDDNLDISENMGNKGESNESSNNKNNVAIREKFLGPSMITFDGDQTLYSDGANFESNPKLANYLYLLLKHGVVVAVVTAAGYEYNREQYEFRLSGLLAFFAERKLTTEECERFYLFGGECNYLLRLGDDYHLHPVREHGPGGWLTSTKHLDESPGNWDEGKVKQVLDIVEESFFKSAMEQRLRNRVIRKKMAVGLIPKTDEQISREALDEAVLRVQDELEKASVSLPYCAFNGGRDAWVDVGNKRVGVQILQSYLGFDSDRTLHIGDQFLNTGNDYAAREVCPCVWITSPEETTYILKSILRLAGVSHTLETRQDSVTENVIAAERRGSSRGKKADGDEQQAVDFAEMTRRTAAAQLMDVYTGEMKTASEGMNPATIL